MVLGRPVAVCVAAVRFPQLTSGERMPGFGGAVRGLSQIDRAVHHGNPILLDYSRGWEQPSESSGAGGP